MCVPDYGECTATICCELEGGIDTYLAAWVLGDKLQAVGFKNYLMGSLYPRYCLNQGLFGTSIKPKQITPATFSYILDHTTTNSRLRQLFKDIVTTWFQDPNHVGGSGEEWDEVLQDHEDARVILLTRLRCDPSTRHFVKDKEDYME